MKLAPMHDYGRTVADFRWELPATFNFGRDVVDRRAEENDGLALLAASADAPTQSFQFSDISRQSSQLAHVLRRGGLRAGDRIIVQLPRIAMWHVAMTACTKLGAIPIPCVEMLTAKDIAYRIHHSGAVAAITTPSNTGKYAESPDLRLKLSTQQSPGWLALNTEMAREAASFDCADTPIESPAILYYTSGSSGNPKGVTHAARALYVWKLSAAYWQGLDSGDINWCTADTGWAKSGTGVLFAPWGVGSAVVTYHGGFDPVQRLELMAQLRVTVFCAAATEFRHLVQTDVARHDLSRLRLCVSAGESVNPEVVHRWRELSGVPLLDGYGQTETLMTILNYSCLPVKAGSMGKPIPGSAFDVLDERHAPVADGTVGEIAMRLPNPQFMLGYWNDPEKTSAGLAQHGDQSYWLTGDLGLRDSDGYFFYTGRNDDIISSAGYRIGPMEVENALMEHAAVVETAVVGKPDPERGEVVKAFVVLRDGLQASPALVKELQDHVKAVTAPYKYPREIEFRAELPKSVAGKLLRRVLREAEIAAASREERR